MMCSMIRDTDFPSFSLRGRGKNKQAELKDKRLRKTLYDVAESFVFSSFENQSLKMRMYRLMNTEVADSHVLMERRLLSLLVYCPCFTRFGST